jgi:RimJ/RimL family protein N-acetyltransferase
MKKIITDNLYLRQLLVSDISSEYIKALNDKGVVGLTEARHIKWDIKKVKEYVKKSNVKGVSLLIGIFLKNSGKHIGNIRLFNFNRWHKRLELGIMIFDKSQWGKGYGTKSLKAVTRYVFESLKLHKICADYYSLNVASAKMFKKLGFEIEGVFKDHFLLDGNYVDSIRIAKFNKFKK